jgi:hypothetical protein
MKLTGSFEFFFIKLPTRNTDLGMSLAVDISSSSSSSSCKACSGSQF